MTAQAAALELIENPNMTTAAEIDRAIADALPDDQLSPLEISHEIRGLNILSMAEMVLELHEGHSIRPVTVDAAEQWCGLVELAQGVSARGVAA